MRIVAFGDIHEATGNVGRIDGISSADCVIITGDLTNFGGSDKAEAVLNEVRRYNSRVYALAGNLDQKDVDELLNRLGINLHAKGFLLSEDVGIFGVGGSNVTPFGTPIEYGEEEIRRFIASGYEVMKAAPVKIFVSHAPPFDTRVDVVSSGAHVGSKAVRSFIEDAQPTLCITGHIHEAPGTDALGKTPVLNPGMLKNGGYVEVLIEGRALKAELKKIG